MTRTLGGRVLERYASSHSVMTLRLVTGVRKPPLQGLQMRLVYDSHAGPSVLVRWLVDHHALTLSMIQAAEAELEHVVANDLYAIAPRDADPAVVTAALWSALQAQTRRQAASSARPRAIPAVVVPAAVAVPAAAVRSATAKPAFFRPTPPTSTPLAAITTTVAPRSASEGAVRNVSAAERRAVDEGLFESAPEPPPVAATTTLEDDIRDTLVTAKRAKRQRATVDDDDDDDHEDDHDAPMVAAKASSTHRAASTASKPQPDANSMDVFVRDTAAAAAAAAVSSAPAVPAGKVLKRVLKLNTFMDDRGYMGACDLTTAVGVSDRLHD